MTRHLFGELIEWGLIAFIVICLVIGVLRIAASFLDRDF